MARTKAPFKLCEGGKRNDKHIRLTSDMMMNKVYMELSDSAKTVYSYMKLYACGNDVFEYPVSLALKYTSKSTFLRAKDELIQNGFIEYEQNNRIARVKNKYKLSGEWRHKKPIPHGNI